MFRYLRVNVLGVRCDALRRLPTSAPSKPRETSPSEAGSGTVLPGAAVTPDSMISKFSSTMSNGSARGASPLSSVNSTRNPPWLWPASLRLHYFAGGGLITRFFYRYYRDGFGVRTHSLELELPLKLSPIFTLTPVYRYHRQRASSFFEPYRINQPGAEFYTSDYDLSTFSSHKIGLGLQLSPIGRWRMLGKRRLGELTSISLRIAHYRRSDGLRAWMGSMLWGWAF